MTAAVPLSNSKPAVLEAAWLYCKKCGAAGTQESYGVPAILDTYWIAYVCL